MKTIETNWNDDAKLEHIKQPYIKILTPLENVTYNSDFYITWESGGFRNKNYFQLVKLDLYTSERIFYKNLTITTNNRYLLTSTDVPTGEYILRLTIVNWDELYDEVSFICNLSFLGVNNPWIISNQYIGANPGYSNIQWIISYKKYSNYFRANQPSWMITNKSHDENTFDGNDEQWIISNLKE